MFLGMSDSGLPGMSKRALAGVAAGLVLIAALLFLFRSSPPHATLLLINAKVYTLESEHPTGEAIAIAGETILDVGSSEEMLRRYRADSTIDLRGKPVYPGFIDAHLHVEGVGTFLMNLDLRDASLREIQQLVARQASTTGRERWIRGRGWDQNLWKAKRFPGRFDLDAVAQDRPVYLTRVDGHVVWVNSRVLEIARITRETPDPEGGKILRDGSGNPTGVFVDNAVLLLDSVLPRPGLEERQEAIILAFQEFARCGLTSVHDMGVDSGTIAIYKRLYGEGRMPLRVYAAIEGTGKTWEEYATKGPEINILDGFLSVRALKLYADGALGSRGAALIEPYNDDPGNRGLTLISSDELKRACLRALERGFQVCTHAIGDRGNALTLQVYTDVLTTLSDSGLSRRFRVEHAQILAPQEIERMNCCHVIPSMQPSHCTSDMAWVEERVGPVRAHGAYAWKSLIRGGSIIPAGSDAPAETPDPLWGFYSAITRENREGLPAGGWHGEERMSREEALRAFTLWGAYAAFQEKMKGSISPGKWADLTVLTGDIMTCEPREILSTSVSMTIVNGRIVYRALDDTVR
jgi:predicted amidohydrolase YtcJ